MAITKTPYEFLCRWDENGKFKAYHFKTLTTVTDGEEVIAVKESEAMNAAMADAAGFPIKDILSAIHTDSLKAMDVAVSEKGEMAVKLQEAITLLSKINGENNVS